MDANALAWTIAVVILTSLLVLTAVVITDAKKSAKAEKAKQAAEAKVSEMRQQVEESKASGVAASETILLELRESKAEIERLSEEASHYRARAVKTLKSKDDEIAQLKDEAHITGLHERLQSLEDVNERVTSELSAARDEAEKLRDELAKLGQEAASRMREVKEGYQKRLAELEGKLVRMREETMENASSTLSASKAQQPASTDEALALELSELRRAAAAAAKGRDGAASDLRRREAAHAAERKEFESFRTMASAMLEEKDEEIRKLLDELADERSALRRRENQPAAAAATASNALPRPSASASPRQSTALRVAVQPLTGEKTCAVSRTVTGVYASIPLPIPVRYGILCFIFKKSLNVRIL